MKNKFEDLGYLILKNFWSSEEINNFHISFDDLLKLQLNKMGLLDVEKTFLNIEDSIQYLSVLLEQNNRNAFNEVIQMQREMYLNTSTLFNKHELIETSSELLGCSKLRLKIHQDGCLVNFPNNLSRLYRYHSEQHYYPYRRNFLNVWFPLVNDKTSENGTMHIRPKGHLRDYSQFSEFSGFSSVKGPTISESENLYQLDIPDIDMKNLEIMPMELNVGDLVLFNQNMPHTSTINNSSHPSFAYILRIYDFTNDRTLSNNNGVKRYSVDAARNGFINFNV
jgi:ectoine hydroxylase-related dioxygenase (phytanoyl-CoA dioxygenase family)